MARATKTSLAIKMNACFYCYFQIFRVYFNSLKLANIGELLTDESWRPHLRFGLLEEIEFVPVFTSPKQRRKRTFNVVLVQVVKKTALHVQSCKICCFSFTNGARLV